MRIRQYLGPLLLCLLAATLAHAQQPSAPTKTTGSISGTVVDINDDAVPHATLILEGQSVSDHATTVSGADGFFEFSDLPAGTYSITINVKGFANWVSPPIVLKPGLDVDLQDVTLKLATAMTSVNATTEAPHEIATQEVKVEETQRLLGAIPNFYVLFSGPYAPLSPQQKFSLAWRSGLDPVNLAINGIFAGVQQGLDAIPQWGQDLPGYGQRYGALLASGETDIAFTGFIFPVLFRQDPRYIYNGKGTKMHRALYAMATSTVVCKGDNGHWQPAYSNVIGNFATAGITNYYYPATDRGMGLTAETAALNTAASAISGLLEEFVLRRFTSHANKP